MATITVFGSLNVDMVSLTPRIPAAGETIRATSFSTHWGGKGANQAVAAVRLRPPKSDITVRMVGAVGDDVFGPEIIKSLENDGIDVSGVRRLRGEKTGTAVILVEESGENRILFTPGANFGMRVEDNLVPEGKFGDIAVFQLETPLDVVVRNIRFAKASGTRVILNPAPAQKLPEDIYPELTYLIMNETEAAILSGRPLDSLSESCDLDSIAAEFIERGVANVIITLGSAGSYYQTSSRLGNKEPGKRASAMKAKVVDTTAAGDTFVGAFAVRLADVVVKGHSHDSDGMDDAIAFAMRAAGKTVENAGAQSSIPWCNEVI